MVLATSSLGAVWSSSPPEFGVSAILERFTQLKPKVLLTADKYRVRGKDLNIADKLVEVVANLRKGGLKHVIMVGQLEKDRRPRGQLQKFDGVKTVAYPDFLDESATEVKFWRGPANAPLWVLYSSGTSECQRVRLQGMRPFNDLTGTSQQLASQRPSSTTSSV